MPRARVAYLSVLAALVACNGLKNADVPPPVDGGGTTDANGQVANDGDAAGDDDGAPSTAVDGGDAGDAGDAAGPRPYACGDACPIELLSDLADLRALAVDDSTVYFVESFGGVRACPKAGCTAATLVKFKAFDIPTTLVAQSGLVYWSRDNLIVSCPKAGCAAASTVLTEASTINLFTADDSGRVVWSLDKPTPAIRGCRLGSCAAETIIETGPSALALRGSMLAWIDVAKVSFCTYGAAPGVCVIGKRELGAGVIDVALGKDRAFWLFSGEIRSCPLTGCVTPTTVVRGQSPARMAPDGDNLYWVNTVANAIYRCPQTGCDRPELVATVDDASFTQIAVDANHVYWTSRAGLFRREK